RAASQAATLVERIAFVRMRIEFGPDTPNLAIVDTARDKSPRRTIESKAASKTRLSTGILRKLSSKRYCANGEAVKNASKILGHAGAASEPNKLSASAASPRTSSRLVGGLGAMCRIVAGSFEKNLK